MKLNISNAKETEKTKIRYYEPNYKNDQDSIITAKEWQMVDNIILLLELFL